MDSTDSASVLRQTVLMTAVVVVLADTEDEAEALRVLACAALGLEPLGRPLRPVGRERWMARATVVEPVEQ